VVEGGIATGISIIPVALWPSIVTLAVTAGTVSELTGGRFVLGLGSGGIHSAGYRGRFGIANSQPLTLMRDYLIVLRRLLSAEEVSYDGRAIRLTAAQIGFRPPNVPLYLAALGPKMLGLCGSLADGAALNWCTREYTEWARGQIAEAAVAAGRGPSSVRMAAYIRICVDNDEAAARHAVARSLLEYALAPIGTALSSYRGHFDRLGFGPTLARLDAWRADGVSIDKLADELPGELLRRVAYFGPASGAALALRELSQGLDLAIVRVVSARAGLDAVLATVRACA
jgi:alkanesulfonate monooxygenase SsuD/methylene tetrahydromethanopterin reductase-like flavin-dependent oxidoreductase (luciferase family)